MVSVADPVSGFSVPFEGQDELVDVVLVPHPSAPVVFLEQRVWGCRQLERKKKGRVIYLNDFVVFNRSRYSDLAKIAPFISRLCIPKVGHELIAFRFYGYRIF